jgi:hypothetical protein
MLIAFNSFPVETWDLALVPSKCAAAFQMLSLTNDVKAA